MIINHLTELRGKYRDGTGIKKAALARKIGVSRSYITKVENGTLRPSAEMMFRIARALRVDVETAFEHVEDKR